MPDSLSNPETSLNSFFTTLYPNLSDENLPSSYSPLETFDIQPSTAISDPAVTARNNFLTKWKASVEIESSYLTEISRAHQTSSVRKLILQLEEEKKKTHKATNNILNQYVYLIVKDKLESTVTPDTIRETTRSLKNYIVFILKGDGNSVNPLVQQLQIVHGKQREFNTELITVLTREALLQQAGLRKTHTELIKEKEKVDKKWKAAEEKLKEQREDINN
ncbi:hypothetical protein DAPPUDRAFT_108214 [Daphnia pulex]|uniref:Uncharacterized protein n=1 Tax=Daphnia pulex TaxID=6669 RepID=E9GZH4_DAPPU|nr:hypothetical protein DAPPUDRAFT_108214 [Daphnia pulex]|eukprot:EFX75156.1 hypothetical protein DAPPUDRAFT_108214 [Daphnia pulex]